MKRVTASLAVLAALGAVCAAAALAVTVPDRDDVASGLDIAKVSATHNRASDELVHTVDFYGGVVPAMYSDGGRARRMVAALRSRQPGRVAANLGNTLERVAAPHHREVEQMEAALLAAGALGASMSGSGLTVVGVARSYDHARQIRARVTRARWACWAVRALRGPAIRLR